MGQVYATADWHGCANPALKVFDYLKEDDTLYFVGDAADRGPDGLTLIRKLLNDPRVIYLMGNHEKMMEDVLYSLISGRNFGQSLWMMNGGKPTFTDLILCSGNEQLWYLDKLKSLPYELTYHSPKGHDVILEHAGYSPFGLAYRSREPLWDRDHFCDPWTSPWDAEDSDAGNTFLVHGHTPVPALQYWLSYIDQPHFTKEDNRRKEVLNSDADIDWDVEVLRYCEGHKFDIDMFTVRSGRVALLNLDTFETIYFDAD